MTMGSDRTSTHTSRNQPDEIEFLTPRIDVFGDAGDGFALVDSDDPTGVAFADVDDAPRSRTASILAGLGLVALIVVGVVAAAPWSSDDEAAAPSTTEQPTTTDAPATTVEPVVPVPSTPVVDAENDTDLAVDLSRYGPGFVIVRPPTGMRAVGAYDQGSGDVPIAHLDIWATPEADRSTGTWLAIAATSYADGQTDLLADASVVDIGGIPGLVALDRDDVTIVTWRPREGVRIALASHGMALDRLLATAAGIGTVGNTITYAGAPAADDGTPLDRIIDEDRSSGDIGAQVVQLAERVAVYQDSSGTTSLVVGTRKAEATDETITRFLLATATTKGDITVSRRVKVNGLDVAVGSLSLSPGANVVQWRAGDDWITVIGTVPIDRLIRSLRTGRMATEEEWDALVEQAYEPDPSPAEDPVFATIGSGTVAGSGWGAALSEQAGYLVLRSDAFYFSERVEPDPEQPVSVYRSVEATFVVAIVDEPSSDSLLVEHAGGDPITVPLVPIPGGTWSGAVAAFEGSAELHAVLVDASSPP
jgi:hypothetical protein